MTDPLQWTEADVLALVGQSESARLEFKSGRLFESKDKAADEISKQVSAFANSEGGILVIGMAERDEGKQRMAPRERKLPRLGQASSK